MRQNGGRGRKRREDGRSEHVSVQGLKWKKEKSHYWVTSRSQTNSKREQQGQRGAYFTCEEYLLKAHVWFQVVRDRVPQETGNPCPCLGSQLIGPFISLEEWRLFALPRDLSLKGSLQLKEGVARLSFPLHPSPCNGTKQKALGSRLPAIYWLNP